jgi:hypothetical protein
MQITYIFVHTDLEDWSSPAEIFAWTLGLPSFGNCDPDSNSIIKKKPTKEPRDTYWMGPRRWRKIELK